ncbi:flagellin [Sedimenticola selenatireducens]|uniref:flagellin N-terminal helical domain-containing protein n=1 Tax=Sedimenticola selenatireducens TaxID=191960 RepID=UPI00048E55AC|nr:flagellin [Sedimenticola selenatireducens]
MAQIINTNIASLTAQRNLNKSQSSMATAMERLSSGLRINSAKDDAAGLAISERMTSQIRGLNQAIRNSNDGISLSQTAEGALGEITNNLQRVRELSVQSANSTNSASDRAALDEEVQQLLAEIDRVASQTSFNNQRILDGTFGSASFQVGANVGETISINLATSMRTTSIGKTADYVNSTTQFDTTKAVGSQGTGVNTSAIASGNVTIAIGSNSAVTVGASQDYSSTGAGRTAGSAYSKADAINSAGISGLTAVADTTVQLDLAANAVSATNTGYSLSLNGVAIVTGYDGTADGAMSSDTLVSLINSNASASGVTASYDSANTRITLTASDGRNIAVSQTNTTTTTDGFQGIEGDNNAVNTTTDFTPGASGAAATATYGGTLRLISAESIAVAGTAPATIGFTTGSMALGNSALSSSSVTTVANANTTLTRVDAALSSVSTLRSTFGAVQNRFETTIANLSVTSENLSAARSRIQDADFAAETAAMTRSQILQQAGVAMVSQANALPQSVLSLLQ